MDVRAYLWSLTLVCVASAVVRAASGNDATKKYIDLLCSLCVICAIVIPVAREFSELDADGIGEFFEEDVFEYGQEDYGEIYNSYLHEGSVTLAEETLENGLLNALELGAGDIKVTLLTDTSGETPRVCEAVATLYGKAYAADPELIKSYIEEQTGAECRIIYGNVDE